MAGKLIYDLEPDFKSYEPLIDAICHAAKVAEDVRSHSEYGKLTKSDSSPVTVADLAVQMVLVNAIKNHYPGDLIIAEEDSSSLADKDIMAELRVLSQKHGFELNMFRDLGQCTPETRRFWTIDPIDGTKGFLRNGQYAICLALVEDERVKAAFIACPNLTCNGSRGMLYCALAGAGVYEVALRTCECVRLATKTTPLVGSVMVESVEAAHTSHGLSAGLREALQLHRESIRLDSQCKYCMVARGDVAVYLRKPKTGYQEKIWDHAAGSLMVEETGGRMTDFAGSPVVFKAERTLKVTGGIVASTYFPQDHAKLVDHLSGCQSSS